eukprot:scaffold43425_cov57-Attheya_sp.AAC.3
MATRRADSSPLNPFSCVELDMSIITGVKVDLGVLTPNPFKMGDLVRIVKDDKEERIKTIAIVVRVVRPVTVELQIDSGPLFQKRLTTIQIACLDLASSNRPMFEEPDQSHSDSYYHCLTHDAFSHSRDGLNECGMHS